MNNTLLKGSLVVCAAAALWCVSSFCAQEKKEEVKTTITADKLEYDIEENVAYLRGRVVVKDDSGILAADNATVYFGTNKNAKAENSSLKSKNVGSFYRVVALGNVKISSGEKIVVAEKAVWDRTASKIVLTGGPPIVQQGSSYVRATRIVYNVETQTCEFYPNPEVVLQPSAEDRKRFTE